MERMEKQTAVEWFDKQLDNLLELYPSEWDKVKKVFEKAKAMEKEQIENAFNYGQFDLGMEANEYFDNTFKSE